MSEFVLVEQGPNDEWSVVRVPYGMTTPEVKDLVEEAGWTPRGTVYGMSIVDVRKAARQRQEP
jgi:hypothetical protein